MAGFFGFGASAEDKLKEDREDSYRLAEKMRISKEGDAAAQRSIERANQIAADARKQELLQSATDSQNAAIEKGRTRGNEIFGNNALGRISAGRSADLQSIIDQRRSMASTAGQRTNAITDILTRREQAQGQQQSLSQNNQDILSMRRSALQGFNSQENNALREQGLQGIQQGQQTALRQLRGVQAGSGIRGGLQAAQQAQALNAGQAARGQLARDLFLQNIGQKEKALAAFEQSSTGIEGTQYARQQDTLSALEASRRAAETEELGRKTGALGALEGSITGAEKSENEKQIYNQAQANKELFGKLTTEMGYAGLNAAQQSALMQQIMGDMQAKAMIANSNK